MNSESTYTYECYCPPCAEGTTCGYSLVSRWMFADHKAREIERLRRLNEGSVLGFVFSSKLIFWFSSCCCF